MFLIFLFFVIFVSEMSIEKIIDTVLQKTYPIRGTKFENVWQLSHFWFDNLADFDFFLPFRANIHGAIEAGKGRVVKHVTTHDGITRTWRQYVQYFHSFLNIQYHFLIRPTGFLNYLHTRHPVSELLIVSVTLDNGKPMPVVYVKERPHTPRVLASSPSSSSTPIDAANHFRFRSFLVDGNRAEIAREIKRMMHRRDDFRTMHIHVEGNGGGDNVGPHLIVRCLVGPRERWMKPITKRLANGKSFTWDGWKEDDPNSPSNYDVVQQLRLGPIPQYKTKYPGKIYVHFDEQSGSASWYLITYMVYAFGGNDVKRFDRTFLGKKYKFGRLERRPQSQLVLVGQRSGTTSGDGNSKLVKSKGGLLGDLKFSCPEEQFVDCSIQPNDWNRFWEGQ